MFVDRVLVRVDPPVGRLCRWCTEPIAETDRGLIQSVYRRVAARSGLWSWLRGWRRRSGREWYPATEPIHAECAVREALGGIAHQRGQCRCFGQTESPYPGTPREEALEVVAFVNEQRARRHMGPLW